jgi:HAD superfamily hydrolase (TIGR01484 family)
MPKHFFFDLDKTLTKSRSAMEKSHQTIFERLCAERDVIVVTGGSVEQIREQVTSRFDGKYYVLAQSGNQAMDTEGEILWEEELSTTQSEQIHAFIEVLKSFFGIAVKDENDLVEHRGAQITYSILGFHEDVEKKYVFDPDDSKRSAALASHQADLDNLLSVGVEVTPAGTTSFNFILAGKHKGFNIARLIKAQGWNTQDCIYIGDALFPGGNDESVIGVIPTKAIKDPDETFENIVSFLEK